MKTSLKAGFAQIFSCCPKNLSCPKFGGAAAPLALPPPGPYAYVRDDVFWTEDLIEETTKRLHDSYTILTLIEHDMSAQLNSSLPNLIPRVFVSYYTSWLSERRCRE